MTNHEKLQETYEDSLFALLMDEFAQSEGERLMEENARLALDETAAVPQDIERRCLRLIERETSKQARSRSAAGFLHFLARMALAALIAVMLFGTAFALSPAIRAGTLNLLMQIDERAASWQFVTESEDTSETPDSLPDITIGWLPEGYVLSDISTQDQLSKVFRCTNSLGDEIVISVLPDKSSTYSIDIENSDFYTDVSIHGNPGLLIHKNNVIRISWADQTIGCIFFVMSSNSDEAALLHIAENIVIE